MKNNILVCPECGRVIEYMDANPYFGYHGRENYVCPFCDYHGDSVTFYSHNSSHPYRNMLNINELKQNKDVIFKIVLGGALLLLSGHALRRKFLKF